MCSTSCAHRERRVSNNKIWHALVSTASSCTSSCSGGSERGGGGCVALAEHAEEREGQVRVNDES